MDAKTARLDEGEEFMSQPDGEAIAGTSRNMLGKDVLDAEQYPMIEIRPVALNGPASEMDVRTRIRLYGAKRDIVTPDTVEANGGRLITSA